MCLPANAQQGDTPQILILNSFDQNAAPHIIVPTEAFKTTLQENYPSTVAFQTFNLEQYREGLPGNDTLTAELLRKRFDANAPDLVLAVGPPAIAFWLRQGDTVSPGAPLLGLADHKFIRQLDLRPTDAVVTTEFSLTDAVEDILRLRPETSRILMVFGDTGLERAWAAEARRQLQSYSGRIDLQYTNDMTLSELQKTLSRLPPDSAVFYGIFSRDVNGVSLEYHAPLALVRAASSVPVFGALDTQLGRGIVGGRLMQSMQGGVELARIAEDMLRGKPAHTGWKFIPLSEPRYDWNELQYWAIDPESLPPGSTILFKPKSFWDQYAGWVVAAVALIAAQSLLILALLQQRRHRHLSETARDDLGRRLVTANEDERRILARELHDDLSQRLARLAIDAGFAQSPAGADAAQQTLKNLYPDLVDISKDIHDMSYRLHPSLVEDLGIAAALRAEIERMRRRTKVEIFDRISDVIGPISNDAALCIYRIAQEALRNALRHAHASHIDVSLESDDRGVTLSVRDDGAGFDPANRQAKESLGLLSMKERAQLANGVLKINSRIGEGTTVVVTIPLAEAPA